jgi:DNA primase catalytic subunit
MVETPSKAETIAQSHYSRPDIQKAMFDFCKHRETVANFDNKFFAKRPDTFDYPSDILNQAKQGATSFHCSEEIWTNPLDINTDMTPQQYNEIRTGWDLIIDIDSPYLDYGKIAARLLIKELENHGIQNIGIKFSGSKGFHIIVPFKAFPKSVDGVETKNQFPDWPRAIAQYLFNKIRNPMNEEILKLSSKEKLKEQGELLSEHLCPKCKTPTKTKKIGTYLCSDIKCKTQLESMKSNRKDMVCPGCNGKMKRISQREIQYCETCKANTAKLEATSSFGGIKQKPTQEQFKEEITIKSTEDSVDVVLVSSRHLFRAPYSLHEKTAYASIPLDKSQIQTFRPSDAEPIKITKIKSFMPSSIEGEATKLLAQALKEAEKNKPKETQKKYDGKGIDLKGLTITEEMYPPIIKKLLLGIPNDGRKRALSLMLAFFTSLEFPQDYIEEKIEIWNNKNYAPLKQGYIKAQIAWSIKNKRLPPNYDKPIYKEFGITSPPAPGIKNPINYTIKRAFAAKSKTSEDFYVKQKNKHEI